MPWHRPDSWDRTTLGRLRALTAVRRASVALRQGGLRWAHVDDDAVAYLRETADERMLVLARRAVGCAGVAGRARRQRHRQRLRRGNGAPPSRRPLVLPADGPTLQIWRLR